jgi:hypothetical protein
LSAFVADIILIASIEPKYEDYRKFIAKPLNAELILAEVN